MIKNKYLISIYIIIILILIITGIIYICRYNVLKNDNNQINVLYNIFNEDENINLNNSALINFITGKELKDKSLLLELENKNTTGKNVVLSIKYNKKRYINSI